LACRKKMLPARAFGRMQESNTIFSTSFPTASHSCALGVPHGCSFFAARQRTNQENAPKGLMPFGIPQRKKGASLSLCSFFCDVLPLQLLRLQVKETCKHGGARYKRKQAFVPAAPHLVTTKFQAKTILLSPPAARGVCIGARHQNIFVTSPVAPCRAAMPRGFPGGTPGLIFFRTFFVQ